MSVVFYIFTGWLVEHTEGTLIADIPVLKDLAMIVELLIELTVELSVKRDLRLGTFLQ